MNTMRHFKAKTIDRINERFYKKLNESSKGCRRLAEGMSEFLMPLKNQNPEIDQLITSYQAFQTVDIKKIDTAIDSIKNIFLKLDTDNIRKNKLPFNKDGLETFFEKQNQFNKAAILLVEQAVEIYNSCHKI